MKLLIVRGDPGIGKSSFCNALALRLAFTVVDKDLLKDILFPEYVPDFERCDEACYRCCLASVGRSLRIGVGVVVDDILNREWVFNELVAIAARCGVEWRILDCFVSSDELWDQRLRKRSDGDVAEHRIRSLEAGLRWRQTRRLAFQLPEDRVIRVCLDGPTENSAAATLRHIVAGEP